MRYLLAVLVVVFFVSADAYGFERAPRTLRRAQPRVFNPAIQATGWAPNTIMVGAERQKIRSMDILHRPNRPLHFYGNTVRFLHYRGLSR